MQNRISKDILSAMKERKPYEEEIAFDTAKPIYHFSSPCGLMLDVWGGIYKDGNYHLFYDNNYNKDPRRMGGCFGHLVSSDLVNWKELPFALLPEEEKFGEISLNDGFVVIDKQNKPLMYYTRCFTDTTKNREHVAVRGSDDLLTWERINDGNAVLTLDNHGGPDFHMSWSDVVLFSENGRTFMIISKCTKSDGKDMIPIYEAVDDTLLKWEYKGVFANHTGECINFVKIKDKWVLIYSPYNNPKYMVGHFDIDNYRFVEENNGILSYGYINQGWQLYDISRGFYATSTFKGKDDKTYILGWISGFEGTKNWNGCVSLARELELDESNNILMKPVKALENLRKEAIDFTNSADLGRAFELNVKANLEKNQALEIKMDNSFCLKVTQNHITFNDIVVDFDFKDDVDINMYVDVSMAEIFFNGGKISLSRCFKEIKDGTKVEITTNGKLKEFKAYKF